MSEQDPFGQPVRHLSAAVPPWSTVQPYTLCGRPTNDVASVVGFEDARALVQKHGQARSAFLFCQTCFTVHGSRPTAGLATWSDYPADVVSEWVGRARYGRHAATRLEVVRAELHALAELVDRHSDEFAARVKTHLEPDELTARRAAKKGPR